MGSVVPGGTLDVPVKMVYANQFQLRPSSSSSSGALTATAGDVFQWSSPIPLLANHVHTPRDDWISCSRMEEATSGAPVRLIVHIETTKQGCVVITVLPPVTVVNCLPCPLTFRALLGQQVAGSEGKIVPTGNATVVESGVVPTAETGYLHALEVGDGGEFAVNIAHYGWSPSVALLPASREELREGSWAKRTVSFKLPCGTGKGAHLDIQCQLETIMGASCPAVRLNLFCSHWLVDRSGLRLGFGISDKRRLPVPRVTPSAADVVIAPPVKVHVSDLWCSTDRGTVLATAATGDLLYGDREYTIKTESLPTRLRGATMIRTACNDKNERSQQFLGFRVDEASTVHVLYDRRCSTPPDWLTSNFQMSTMDAEVVHTKQNGSTSENAFLVWASDFPAGAQVNLGGNRADKADTMYVVIITEAQIAPEALTDAAAGASNTPYASPVSEIRCSSKRGTVLETATADSLLYVDREYTIKADSLPSNLRGATMLRTAGSDKRDSNKEFLRFRVDEESTVHVLFDRRCPSPPDWLTQNFSMSAIGAEVAHEMENGPTVNTFVVWKRNYPAGAEVTLGGNKCNKADTMYSVIITKEEIVRGSFTDVAARSSSGGDLMRQRRVSSVSDLVCASKRGTAVATARSGGLLYTDREYTIKPDSLPTKLRGATMIRTACSDKNESHEQFLGFSVAEASTVHILYDRRCLSPPAWLTSNFRLSMMRAEFVHKKMKGSIVDCPFAVWTHNFPAGAKVNLGGNKSDKANTMYVVIVTEVQVESGGLTDAAAAASVAPHVSQVSELRCTSKRDTTLATATTDSLLYTDREYIIKADSLPSRLRGATIIRTACSDKNDSDQHFLRFRADEAAAVHVLFDRRCPSPPDWLTSKFSMSAIGAEVAHEMENGATVNTFVVWTCEYPAGAEVTLGGNKAPKADTMYVVLITEAETAPEAITGGVAALSTAGSPNRRQINTREDLDDTWALGNEGLALCNAPEEEIILAVPEGAGFGRAVRDAGGDSNDDGFLGHTPDAWSKELAVTTGSSGVFQVDGTQGEVYELALRAETCPGTFRRTTLVTVVPRYCIVNLLEDESIWLKQPGAPDSDAVSISPGERLPWHWVRGGKSSKGGVRVRTAQTAWSYGDVMIDRVGTTALHVPSRPEDEGLDAQDGLKPNELAGPRVTVDGGGEQEVVHVDVKLADDTFVDEYAVLVVFWKATDKKFSPIYAVRNTSPVAVQVYQAAGRSHKSANLKEKAAWKIESGEERQIGWAFPSAPHSILISSVGGAREYELNADTIGNYTKIPTGLAGGDRKTPSVIWARVIVEGGTKVIRISSRAPRGSGGGGDVDQDGDLPEQKQANVDTKTSAALKQESEAPALEVAVNMCGFGLSLIGRIDGRRQEVIYAQVLNSFG